MLLTLASDTFSVTEAIVSPIGQGLVPNLLINGVGGCVHQVRVEDAELFAAPEALGAEGSNQGGCIAMPAVLGRGVDRVDRNATRGRKICPQPARCTTPRSSASLAGQLEGHSEAPTKKV